VAAWCASIDGVGTPAWLALAGLARLARLSRESRESRPSAHAISAELPVIVAVESNFAGDVEPAVRGERGTSMGRPVASF
jgi:hypothetical protein